MKFLVAFVVLISCVEWSVQSNYCKFIKKYEYIILYELISICANFTRRGRSGTLLGKIDLARHGGQLL